MKNRETFSLSDIASLVDLPVRTIRFYIQLGLVSRPGGSNKGSFYTQRHVEELLAVKKWKEAGLSLERIARIMAGVNAHDLPPAPKARGDVEVWSHVHVAEGVTVMINPALANLTPEQVRELTRRIVESHEAVIKKEEP